MDKKRVICANCGYVFEKEESIAYLGGEK